MDKYSDHRGWREPTPRFPTASEIELADRLWRELERRYLAPAPAPSPLRPRRFKAN